MSRRYPLLKHIQTGAFAHKLGKRQEGVVDVSLTSEVGIAINGSVIFGRLLERLGFTDGSDYLSQL
ncbi:hypothetical protein [Sporosarcina ureae]|uniref:hypothetical protein n=1 Tax=Sporosarcina ureae TaxID=1571 RepID=UPI0028A9B571|nr:hypothetical protein [Sporosarcina ureae]